LRTRAQEQVIRQQRDELHESLSLRDELLAMVVHDLRNPLTSVLAAFDFLKGDASLSEVSARDVADGLTAARRVSSVTEDILKLLTADGMTQQRRLTRLRPLVDRAAAALASVARSHDVHIDVTGDAEVEVDPDLILRAVENLVGNAIRYAPGGSPITVSVDCEGEHVVIRVEDRGPGVPVELRDAIFGKSVRRERTGHRSYGLGLYLVDVVARAHGGHVGVRPRDGGGSTFFVSLQRATAA
jgi:signal transduction histidine kinase